jgi:hypothetical protein
VAFVRTHVSAERIASIIMANLSYGGTYRTGHQDAFARYC